MVSEKLYKAYWNYRFFETLENHKISQNKFKKHGSVEGDPREQIITHLRIAYGTNKDDFWEENIDLTDAGIESYFGIKILPADKE